MIGSEGGYGPESVLGDVRVDAPLHELRGRLDHEIFPRLAEHVAETCSGLAAKQRVALIAASMTALYQLAIKSKDWRRADWLCIEALRYHDLDALREILYAEGRARAFNILLAEHLARASVLMRYIDAAEVLSYVGGTFESRIEYGIRRGYKAFSIYKNHFSLERPIIVEVPIDNYVRRAVRPVAYTALLRPLLESEERIDDQKYITYAHETECRIPDGTRVPSGTKMWVRTAKLDANTNVEELRSVCRSLDMDVAFI